MLLRRVYTHHQPSIRPGLAVWKLLPAMLSTFLLLIMLSTVAHGFYVPGVAPQDFRKGDSVEVKVNILKNSKKYLKKCKKARASKKLVT